MSHAVVLGLGFDGPVLGLSMGLKPVTKCDSCERGEPRESNISILYAEMGIEIELLSFFSTTSPALVIGRNRPHLPSSQWSESSSCGVLGSSCGMGIYIGDK